MFLQITIAMTIFNDNLFSSIFFLDCDYILHIYVCKCIHLNFTLLKKERKKDEEFKREYVKWTWKVFFHFLLLHEYAIWHSHIPILMADCEVKRHVSIHNKLAYVHMSLKAEGSLSMNGLFPSSLKIAQNIWRYLTQIEKWEI